MADLKRRHSECKEYLFTKLLLQKIFSSIIEQDKSYHLGTI